MQKSKNPQTKNIKFNCIKTLTFYGLNPQMMLFGL